MPFTFTPQSVALSRPALTIGVFRYFPDTDRPYWYLPNVLCLGCQYREGPEPPVARFRYSFDELATDGRPLGFEEVFPLDAVGDFIVQNDDRLAVLYFLPDGSSGLVFDGFASVPQADVSADGQQVTFLAYGVPIREWDTPIGGAVYRESDRPTVGTGSADIQTDLPVRFNPEGQPNATADGADSGEAPQEYPLFLDSNTIATGAPRHWTLDMAIRYIVATTHTYLIPWTEWPDLDAWTPYLQAWRPADGDNFDPADPATYDREDIRVSDVDLTGEPWPAAMARLVEPHNIGICWRLGVKDGIRAAHYLDLFRRDAPVGVKAVKLQPRGQALDPARTNIGAVSLARDVAGLATEIEVLTGPTRHEISVILTPEFAVAAGDATSPSQWVRTNANYNPTKYRRFVFGEDGRERWSFASSALITGYQGLASVLADPDLDEKQEQQYVHRPRPGLNTLVSTDSAGNPLKAELWISKDYAGTSPRLWDRADTSHWQKVSGGSWKLLDDCLGVELTMDDPENWNVGSSDDANAPFGKHGKVQLVTSLAAPTTAMPRVYFRLTCVIEGDRGIDATAPNRFVGPTTYSVVRTVDCRDRFRKEIVHRSSHINTTGDDVVSRDDTDSALALAYAQQRATELAKFGGSVTIPRITFAYRVGDKIRSIDGRSLSLTSNVGEDHDEGPTYPTVTAVDHSFEGGQTTTIHLSDERSRPERPRRRGGRRR